MSTFSYQGVLSWIGWKEDKKECISNMIVSGKSKMTYTCFNKISILQIKIWWYLYK